MAKRFLVVDLHPEFVCLAIATYDGDCHLIADFAGRVVHSLSAAHLWSARGDNDDGVLQPVRVQLVRNLLLCHEGQLDNWVRVRDAVRCLLRGIKAFAESRLEMDVENLAMVLPRACFPSSRQLIEACAYEVGFLAFESAHHSSIAMKAYGIDSTSENVKMLVLGLDATGIEASVYTAGKHPTLIHSRHQCRSATDETREGAILAIQESLGALGDEIDHVLFMGNVDSDEASLLFNTTLFQGASSVTFHNTIEPREVCAYGMIKLVRELLAPKEPSGVLYCMPVLLFDVGIETSGGVCETFAPRLTSLPTTKSTRIQVFNAYDGGKVELRMCEGQRAVFRENWFIGALSIRGLSVGWNELRVRLGVSPELNFCIDVSVLSNASHSPLGQLKTTSVSADLSFDDVMTYFNDFESMSTSADEIRLRQRMEARHCTDTLVETAVAMMGRDLAIPVTVQHGDVRVVKFRVSDRPDSAINEDTPLPGDQLEKLRARGSQVAHDAALLLLGDRIRWSSSSLNDRCEYCVAFENNR